MKNIADKKPELLAPAGNLAAGITAFDCGADAVYAGLSKFNARERTENFSFNDMSRLIAYARRSNRKVYVTLNTLIKESELPEVASFMSELNALHPDAVIVQDIGVMRMLREYFPNLTIHASTQMGFHNSPGIKLAEKLGAERVILERQITIEEIELIQKQTSVELEIFIHGALCCSLSGQCLFSSWLGGWSGNRGKCKQPCRRRFFGKKGNGFFFSTQDLATLELVPTFKEMGIASLKIEGRLRKPDYVKNAVSAYRLALDAPELDKKTLGEARKILSNTFGRKWSLGFYNSKSMKKLIKHDVSGAAGMLIGKVDDVERNGFGFKVKRRIILGDRVRIQPQSGDEGSALTITKLKANGKLTTKATPGQECFIYCDKDIPYNGLIYKIGENYDDLSSKLSNLAEERTSLDLLIDVNDGKIKVETENATCPAWEREIELLPPKKQFLVPEKLIVDFTSSRSERLQAGTIRANVTGKWFLPASELKKVRREFWEWAEENISPESIFNSGLTGMERFRRDYTALKGVNLQPGSIPETIMLHRSNELPKNRRAIKAFSIFELNRHSEEAVLPSFCPEDKLDSLHRMIKDAIERGIKKFRVTGLYGFEVLKDYEGIEITSSFPLPVCNTQAVIQLQELGLEKTQAWIELERTEIERIVAKSPVPVEVYRYGRPPLLATRASLPTEGDIKDSRDNKFRIIRDRFTGEYFVYPKEVFTIPRLPGTVDFYDLSNASWSERYTSEFNFKAGLM
ncbi:MAG: U32 family peptidase [Lentisphaerae bacterium]|nr:U32 family peptidase [Lentisphaerota bacterium]MCP4101700.1 U32 family peptidase [Lentisphaerota bacterium]